ncbi:hypothetical protein IE077_004528 [Cardiosporidium cionae]|uniref:Uncharacterized protein n=1 Tax=Cardiosporidium cionae TaxID=476202 RepID=A0ABQ7J876_9APIC|nr:hypothetical protein IE077_004528 [Cardiosporidium cionae]|eukprot:KAF8820186.1 hypothetical protein IE077_004528 [Cardiosporidium cionae]
MEEFWGSQKLDGNISKSTKMLYISKFEVGKIRLIVNLRNRRQSNEMRDTEPHSDIMRAVLTVLNGTPHISDANLIFAKELQHDICGLPVEIFGELLGRFVGQGMNQIYRVLGAVDLLGNPLIVAQHWREGGERFFQEIFGRRRGNTASPSFLVCFPIIRGLGYFGVEFLSGFIDGLYRFSGSWYSCMEGIASNTNTYSIAPDLLSTASIVDQPKSFEVHTSEYTVTYSSLFEKRCNKAGGRNFSLNLGISVMNVGYKPIKAISLHLQQLNSTEQCDKIAAIVKGCALGSTSALGSLLFGIPSSFLLCGSIACSGLLNQIHAIPMIQSLRPKRVFNSRSIINSAYQYNVSWSKEYLDKIKNRVAKRIRLVIPLTSNPMQLPREFKFNGSLGCIPFQHHLFLKRDGEKARRFILIGDRVIAYTENTSIVWVCQKNAIVAIDLIEMNVVKTSGRTATTAESKLAYFLQIRYESKGRATSFHIPNKTSQNSFLAQAPDVGMNLSEKVFTEQPHDHSMDDNILLNNEETLTALENATHNAPSNKIHPQNDLLLDVNNELSGHDSVKRNENNSNDKTLISQKSAVVVTLQDSLGGLSEPSEDTYVRRNGPTGEGYKESDRTPVKYLSRIISSSVKTNEINAKSERDKQILDSEASGDESESSDRSSQDKLSVSEDMPYLSAYKHDANTSVPDSRPRPMAMLNYDVTQLVRVSNKKIGVQSFEILCGCIFDKILRY